MGYKIFGDKVFLTLSRSSLVCSSILLVWLSLNVTLNRVSSITCFQFSTCFCISFSSFVSLSLISRAKWRANFIQDFSATFNRCAVISLFSSITFIKIKIKIFSIIQIKIDFLTLLLQFYKWFLSRLHALQSTSQQISRDAYAAVHTNYDIR